MFQQAFQSKKKSKKKKKKKAEKKANLGKLVGELNREEDLNFCSRKDIIISGSRQSTQTTPWLASEGFLKYIFFKGCGRGGGGAGGGGAEHRKPLG